MSRRKEEHIKQRKKRQCIKSSSGECADNLQEYVSGEDGIDLDETVHPIGYYVNDRAEMINQMFGVLPDDRLRAMLPPILKDTTLEELKLLCLEELLGMSAERIQSVLKGRELDSSSDSDDANTEEGNSVCPSESRHNRNNDGSEKMDLVADSNQLGTVEDLDTLEIVINSQEMGDLFDDSPKKKIAKVPSVDDNAVTCCSRMEQLTDTDHANNAQRGNNTNADSVADPDNKGKTLLEILELEMRARAIRALLKQQTIQDEDDSDNCGLDHDHNHDHNEDDCNVHTGGGKDGDDADEDKLKDSAVQMSVPVSPPAGHLSSEIVKNDYVYCRDFSFDRDKAAVKRRKLKRPQLDCTMTLTTKHSEATSVPDVECSNQTIVQKQTHSLDQNNFTTTLSEGGKSRCKLGEEKINYRPSDTITGARSSAVFQSMDYTVTGNDICEDQLSNETECIVHIQQCSSDDVMLNGDNNDGTCGSRYTANTCISEGSSDSKLKRRENEVQLPDSKSKTVNCKPLNTSLTGEHSIALSRMTMVASPGTNSVAEEGYIGTKNPNTVKHLTGMQSNQDRRDGTWTDRWLQSKEVQKVMSTSKICTKIRQRFKKGKDTDEIMNLELPYKPEVEMEGSVSEYELLEARDENKDDTSLSSL